MLKQGFEQLIQDGVELRGERKLGPVSLGLRKLVKADEIVERLGRQVLQIVLPGLVAVPLRGVDDWQAAMAFRADQPVDHLEKKELAHDLKELASKGWRFYNAEGEVGLLGAYGLVGQQPLQARRENVSVDLNYAEAAQHMAKFYRQESLAGELDRGGFQFFAQTGRPEAPFHASRHSSVGKDGQAWLKYDPREPERTRRALTRFDQKMAEPGAELEKVRNFIQHWQSAQALETPEAVVAQKGSDPDLLQALAERLTEFPSTRANAEQALAAVRAEPGAQEWVLAKLLEKPEAPPGELTPLLLPPRSSHELVQVLLGSREDGALALALSEKLTLPEARSKAVQHLLADSSPTSFRRFIREFDREHGLASGMDAPRRLAGHLEVRRMVMHYLDHAVAQNPALEPAASLTRAILEKSEPYQAVRNMDNFQRLADGRNPVLPRLGTGGLDGSEVPMPADLLGLAQSLLESEPRPEAWAAALDRLEPDLGSAAELGRVAVSWGLEPKDNHKLCLALLQAAREKTSPARALLSGADRISMNSQSRAGLVERMTEALWTSAKASPELLEEGRQASRTPGSPRLELQIAAAFWENPQAEPLETAITVLKEVAGQSGLTRFPLEASDRKLAADVLPTLEQALELKRSRSKVGIQDQGSRVVVGGTFIRKRNA